MDGDAIVERSSERVVASVPERSFEVFYRDEYALTLAVVLALRGPRVGAEEVVQEAFLRALRSWDEVCVLDQPAHWVRRVALNVATSRWRRLGAEARALARLGGVRASVAEDASQEVDAAERFWRSVRRLAPAQQRVVALRFAADLSVDEIAAVVGRAPGTVRSASHAARQRLAVLLDVDQEEMP